MKNAFKQLVLCITLGLSSTASAFPHEDMRDVRFSSLTGQQVQAGPYLINYNVHYQSPNFNVMGPYNPAFLAQTIGNAGVAFRALMAERGHPPIDCNRALELDIYHISSRMINDHVRFARWGAANGVADQSSFHVWGLFDPIKAERTQAAILLTARDRRDNELLIVHEMAHYLYERSCAAMMFMGQTESIAQALQERYRLSR